MKLGKPIGKVQKLPAYRYELFITAYEKKVAEMQEYVRRMEKMEQIYNILVEAATPFRLPNDQDLILNDNSVVLTIKAVPNDMLATFDQLAKSIGEALQKTGLHRDGEPSVASYGARIEYKFRVGKFDPSKDKERPTVSIIVELPTCGIRDADVNCEQCTYTYTSFKVQRRNNVRPIGWAEDMHPLFR
jgi:hypothetical protein